MNFTSISYVRTITYYDSYVRSHHLPTGTLLLSQIRHNHQQALVRDFAQSAGCRHPAQKQSLANFVEFAGKAGHAVHHLPVGAIVQAVKLEESIISAFISVLGSLEIKFNQAKRACKISAMLTLSFAMDGWSLNWEIEPISTSFTLSIDITK